MTRLGKTRLLLGAATIVLLASSCGDPAESGDVTVDQLESGIDLTWSGGASDLTASVCWQRSDNDAVGECPMTLTRSGAASPEKVKLADFTCPKCGDVAGESLAGFLNQSVAEGENTKLVNWRVDWTAGTESASRSLESSDAVATPVGDNPFGSG